jgi:Trk K+ transport system NAD-binding subunit
MATLAISALAGLVLARANHQDDVWETIYVTLGTVFGTSDVNTDLSKVAQVAQLVLDLAGLAMLPLITAAVIEGVVDARLALAGGPVSGKREGHIVLVGLGSVGTRVMRQLTDLGVEVVAIDRNPEAHGVKVAAQLGVPAIVGDAASEDTLRAASVATSSALVVLSTDDVTNLQAALNARAARPDLRVVLRLFDDDFAQRVQTAFGVDISRSVTRLAAPAFAAAMLDRDVLATMPVDRHALLLATVRVSAGSPLEGAPLARAERPASVRVIGLATGGDEWIDWSPAPEHVLRADDRIVVVARRAGHRALSELASQPLREPELES